MNTLSLSVRDYAVTSRYNTITTFWEVEFYNDKVNDRDAYNRFSKIDMETLRDNAKRLYESLDKALSENA
jgi:hypothetical protein